MSRVSDRHKDSVVEQEESVDSELSEEDEDTEDADHEETPDKATDYSKNKFHSQAEGVGSRRPHRWRRGRVTIAHARSHSVS